MSRILILGAAPLPFEPRERQYAPNLRTWHFTKPLIGDGHEIRLVAGRVPNTYPDDVDPVIQQSDRGFEYVSVAGSLFQNEVFLKQHYDEFQPDAILGVNTHPSSRVVSIDTDKPIWCDLNGWVMAEAQAKCRVYGNDRYLSHFWKMEREILDRADVISTVSEAQAFATVGELATRGRLGKETFGYNFVHTIPNAISEVAFQHNSRVIRGVLAPEGAFVVLWAGGYNTWTDVDLLFDALTAAMEEISDLHFVSTGGVIEGHDEVTFNRFLKRIRSSEFSDRFHLAGWVPTADVPSYYLESDIGINVDSDNYETVFGARNRLNEWLKVGLPVLTTAGTEISRIIADNDLGLSCPTGDTAAFAQRLIWAARNRTNLKKTAEKAQVFAQEQFSYGRTTEPLREWAQSPTRAPDKAIRVEFDDVDFYSEQPEKVDLERRLMVAREQLVELEAEHNETRHQLGLIHQSKMWRIWMFTIAVRRWLLRPFGVFRKASK